MRTHRQSRLTGVILLLFLAALLLSVAGCAGGGVKSTDLTGKWTGTLTITILPQEIIDLAQKPMPPSASTGNLGQDINNTGNSASIGCAKQIVALKDKPQAITIDMTGNPDGTGTLKITPAGNEFFGQKVDTSSSSDQIPFTYANGKLTVDYVDKQSSGSNTHMDAAITKKGGALNLDGTWTSDTPVTVNGNVSPGSKPIPIGGTWSAKK